MHSDDPDFETKGADVIGLSLNPPDHPAVCAVDEKTAIQALSIGWARFRCNTQSGEVLDTRCRATPLRRLSTS